MLGVLIFIHKWRGSSKSTPNDRFFEELFMAILLCSAFLLEICWEEIAEEIFFFIFRFDTRPGIRNTFRILFWCLAWYLNPRFSSNKLLPTRPRRFFPLIRVNLCMKCDVLRQYQKESEINKFWIKFIQLIGIFLLACRIR